VLTVRYVSHQFAHLETLERVRRWLIEAGFDPSRIEVHTQGIPRIAVSVAPGEAAEVERLIDAAESADPDGFPGFWELASQQHVYPQGVQPGDPASELQQSESFVVAWKPLDSKREISQTTTNEQIREAYEETGN
jgi:hypothetical protein